MRVLLDTQAWLWMLTAPDRLSRRAREIVTPAENELVLSAATPWELAIKVATGKLTLPAPVEEFVATRSAQTRVTHLPITYLHAVASAALPPLHRDPFDRVLIAQAQLERLPVVTTDAMFRRYGIDVIAAS